MTYSLHNLHVLNTRPLGQAKELSRAIIDAGGIAIECPALKIEANNQQWLSSLPNLAATEYAIFISANAVEHCFTTLEQQKIAWPATVKLIAVGQGTASALKKYGFPIHLIPSHADSEHLLALAELQTVNKKKILLFKGEGGRPLIAETLKSRGADVYSFDVYKRVKPEINQQHLYSLWHNDVVDIILFTSQQAMHNIFALFGEGAHAWLCSKPCLVISERLAKSASLLGIKTILISSPETILKTLHQYNQGLIHGQQQ
ncbi:uroporphyrinogen III methylase [Legionella donaldsonii]|uniref:Uroporphyrinogen-III synthase n=1 Tax=Legionella donaldsonii TaxID=45060 RepID=A0A378IZJ2_9GAMM|nr:uroporphyrinogen-III synthase [Legionella donaldsonii]STX40883.1 uroporphyrinogen III methylase [Legionella donaldsonii]